MKELEHPNIVKFYEYFMDTTSGPEEVNDTADTMPKQQKGKSTLNIVMSYAENGDLNQVSQASLTTSVNRKLKAQKTLF